MFHGLFASKLPLPATCGLLCCVAVALGSCARQPEAASTPELIDASHDRLVIAWEGESNAVEYWPLGKTKEVSVAVDPADTRTHEVRIRGLSSGAQYGYRIKGTEESYNAATQPPASSSVSFVLFNDVSQDEILRHLISHSPGFILSLVPVPPSAFDDVRPFAVVYDPDGNTARYLRRGPRDTPQPGYRIDWGCLVLAVSDDPGYLQNQINALSRGYTLGILTTTKSFEALDLTPLRGHLSVSSTVPAFALLKDSGKVEERGGLHVAGVSAPQTLYSVTVDPESAVMTELPAGVQTDLRLAPVSTKRTCTECRKLAEKGAYRKSVAAYIAFIESNKDNHLVDDAYFEVANIFDEKLFEFDQAIHWYDALVAAYPQSSLAPFAKERLKYLKSFDKAELPAAQEFERIRRVSYLAADESTKARLIERVLDDGARDVGSSLSPIRLYWAANQLRQKDPSRAVGTYRQIAAAYPDHPLAGDSVYAAAETLYESRDYTEAREAYRQALTSIPDRKTSILAQIDRCNRNIRRDTLLWPALLVVLGVVAGSIASRRGHRAKQWKKSALVFGGLSLVLAAWAWAIREQFPNNAVPAALALGSALIAGAAPAVVDPLASKISSAPAARAVFSLSLTALLCVSALYVLIFVVFEHYLTIFGL